MPPTPFHPPADANTYRDLFLFEERLKTNAARLKRTKARYQAFLGFLVLVIVVLLSEVLLDLDFVFIGPTANTIRRFLPVFPYLEVVLLFIAVTTLVLFFATGTYTEKIAYANKYVVHANRSLRSFNMYLNMRAPPLLSSGSAAPASPPPPPQSRKAHGQPVQLAPIPPSTNPRGELIFSTRVSAVFREGYERYRSAFERRREERERAAQRPWFWFSSTRGGRSPSERDGAMLGTPSPAPSRRDSPVPEVPTPLGSNAFVTANRGSMRKRARGGNPRGGTARDREKALFASSGLESS